MGNKSLTNPFQLKDVSSIFNAANFYILQTPVEDLQTSTYGKLYFGGRWWYTEPLTMT